MSRIRVVAAGCGRMSTNFLKAALETGEVEIVGLVDPELSRAQERRAELGLAVELERLPQGSQQNGIVIDQQNIVIHSVCSCRMQALRVWREYRAASAAGPWMA